MHSETLTYEADGLTMQAQYFVADPGSSRRRPGVLVFPEAFGLGDHAKVRARRLAELGYAALACDLHGEGRTFETIEQIMPIIQTLRADPLRIRARAQGALETLRAQPQVHELRVAAIGYCFGGTMALELARSGAGIAAAVGFHSGLATTRPEDAKNIRAKVLACIGADDPGISADERAAFEQEMRAGGVDWQLHIYGGVVHSFTDPEADKRGNPDFLRYDLAADARSWAAMRTLLDEVFD